MRPRSSLLLSDVCQLGDGAHASVKRVENGIPYLTSKNMGPGYLKLDGVDHISSADFENLFPNKSKSITRLREGDVLTGIIGTFNNLYLYTANDFFGISSAIAILRPDPSRLVPKYLFYYLSSPRLQALKEGVASGSVQGYTNLKVVGSLPIELPSLQEQLAVTEILGALDDKIAANTKLDSLATETLAAGFKSMVPLTKQVVSFKEIATVTKGVSYRSVDLVESTSALVTLKSFDRTGGYALRGLKDYAGPHKPAQVITPGEIVVAQTDLTQAAEVVGRAMRVPPSSKHEKLIASLDLAIIRPLEGIPVEFLLGLLLEGKFRAHCQSRTSGTTVLHLASDAIPSFRVPLVAKEVQVAYAHFAKPLLELRESLALENESLARTRDTLLPQLMSGKLRVRDAEKTVEAVV
jgi:type I restriction enzyme S subunit